MPDGMQPSQSLAQIYNPLVYVTIQPSDPLAVWLRGPVGRKEGEES